MKSYTSLEQSRKLAKILPLESADMHYGEYCAGGKDYPIPNCDDDYNGHCCWSLAALLEVLAFPELSKDKIGDGKTGWMVSTYPNEGRYDSDWHDNPVDACVDMIVRLSKSGLI